MSSMKCGSTQQDVDQQPAFRVKLRLKWIVCLPGYGVGEYVRRTRVPASMARDMARLFPTGPEARVMRKLGLEP